ncbi:retinoic acid-induced protein 2 [Misgurnus anguillicaudatus]|uniref:retinoic acid-induced protein 2 n=1 Tax=Misgurnus anguillicaudatus TaxID=75329 RepID=UPI003CCF9FBA
MEEPYKDSVALEMANPQEEVCSSVPDAVGKLESETTPIIPTETWNVGSPTITKQPLSPLIALQATPVVTPSAESPNGVALKVATTVLQPICLGESPVVLPILAGSAAPQVGQSGAASYLMTSQGPVSLPLVLEQQVLQHLNPQLLQQTTTCPILPLQNNVLCQNPSLALGPPPALDQKGASPMLDTSLLTLLQNPNFAAILQDLFPSQGNPSPTCHPASSPPIDLASAFLPPPPLSHPYSSPFASLVPPATLLVPYPIVIPLPVPLPVPLPIPVPVSMCKDSKVDVDFPKSKPCNVNKSTQTSPNDISSHLTLPSKETAFIQPPLPSCPVVTDGEVLDLSIRAPQPSMRVDSMQGLQSIQQDNVLDLSVPSIRKSCIQSRSTRDPPERDRVCHIGEDVSGGTLAVGVLRPVDCTPKLDTKLLSGLASLEFSRQHKWVVDSGHTSAVAGAIHDPHALAGSGNIEIVSTSQTAKVIVSVKDAMPAIFCSKLKGLSGVSTKNFSIKREASQGGFTGLQRVQVDQRGESSDPLKKIPKNRGIKLKKVSSQEIHILPIKKQRLAAFLPRK